MPREEYVVRLSETSDMYMIGYNPIFENCTWGNPENAVIFDTLEEAQEIALGINSGTVGTTKPH